MRRLWGVVLAGLLGSVILAPFAGAQDDSEPIAHLQIQSVDSRDDTVSMLVGWSGAQSALASATIVENGQEVRPSRVEPLPGSDAVVVIAVDTSAAMLPGDALTRLKRGLQDLIESRPAGQRVGIVSFGGGIARVAQRPTANDAQLLAAIDGLAPGGGSVLLGGIDVAARMIGSDDASHGHLVVVAAGPSVDGLVGPGRARGAVTNSGAATWVVAFDDRGAPSEFLRRLVASTGGRYTSTVNVDAMVGYVDEIGEQIADHYVVTYPSSASGPIDLALQVGSDAVVVSFISGSVAVGATALRPVVVESPSGVGFLRDNGFALGLILAVLAVVLAAFAVGSLVAPDRSGLDSALEVYTEGPGGSTAYDDDDGSGLARTALIQRAVGLTEGFAERQGFLAKAEASLERADLPLRAAEGMFFYGVGVILAAVLAYVLTGNILGALVATVLIALVPLATVNFLASRRQKKFEALLPDTLQLLAGTLRAGYSLMQGVEAVSREVTEPMGKELRRVVTEARLGRPLEESMDASAVRMDSDDFAWAVMAIRIQREVGGNLAELLMTVSDTMVQRERLRRDINSLTAEGRVSAFVLGLLPVGLGVVLYMGNPNYIGVLFEERIGQIMIVGSLLLAGAGFYWMKKVIEVDV